MVEIVKNYSDGCGHNDGVNKTEKDEDVTKYNVFETLSQFKGVDNVYQNPLFQSP